jgi:SAM-dependent methyltransferase
VVQPTIDPVRLKEQQRVTWDAVSVGWEASTELFERYAAQVTRHLLAAASVGPGHAVLDIGTGLGEPALSAARLVGPGGRVLGIDLAPAMIEAAHRRAAGMPNVEFAVADVEDGDRLPSGPFDVALSRWGLMFALDHVATFRAIARLLVPGGALAAAVWGPPPAAPIVAFSFAAVSQRLELPPPPPGMPGPFSMADPVRLAAQLRTAGFVDVTVDEVVVPFRFASTAEYVGFSRAITPPGLLDTIRERTGDAGDPATWHAVGEAAHERFADGDGLLLPSTALCLRATTPRAA